jgi:hypothetical protein
LLAGLTQIRPMHIVEVTPFRGLFGIHLKSTITHVNPCQPPRTELEKCYKYVQTRKGRALTGATVLAPAEGWWPLATLKKNIKKKKKK